MYALRLLEEGGTQGGIGWMVWVVLVVFLLMAVLGWWVSSKGLLKKEEPAAPAHDEHGHGEHTAHAESTAVKAPQPAAVVAPAAPDDLTILEGVGPKVAKVLNGIGITTFQQLANADHSKLRAALDGAGYKYMEPAGWVDQAVFAAKGDMDGLKKLQSQLKGGRRVA